MQKARRDDFRIEEELRSAKAKYEEASEDVGRRMQDIRDSEVDSTRDLTQFLDAELEYHERCADELRRVRQSWAGGAVSSSTSNGMSGYGSTVQLRPTVSNGGGRSRSNTAQSFTDRLSRTNSRNIYEEQEVETEAPPVRMPIRSTTSSRAPLAVQSQNQQIDSSPRPVIGRSNTVAAFQGGANLERERIGGRISGAGSGTTTPSSTYGVHQNVPNVGGLRGQLRPVTRINTNEIVFADREDDNNTDDTGSPDNWCTRSASPATSIGSLTRTGSNTVVNNGMGIRKAPPPPPPCRSKKPAPPVPARRDLGSTY